MTSFWRSKCLWNHSLGLSFSWRHRSLLLINRLHLKRFLLSAHQGENQLPSLFSFNILIDSDIRHSLQNKNDPIMLKAHQTVSIYSSSCCFKPVCVLCWTQKYFEECSKRIYILIYINMLNDITVGYIRKYTESYTV